MLESIHEQLQQLVFDENKIVTYKLLTRLLKINVNTAKKHLQDFFDLNQDDLNAFYILIGLQKDENEQPFTKIVVVPVAEVDETKKSFIEVTSSHIYCIHKGQLVDSLALFTADCEGPHQNLNEYSAIRNPHIRIESKKRIIKPTTNKSEIKSLQQVTTKEQVEKKNGDIEQTEKRNSLSPSKKKPAKADDHSGVNSKFKSSNIASMFQKKQNEKKPSDEKVQKKDSAFSDIKKTNETNENQSTKTDQKDKKNIKNLFAKQIDKGAQLLSEQSKEKNSGTLKVNSKKKEHNQSRSTKQKSNSRKQKNSGSDSDESEKPKKKKHKRIVEVEDSESESENEESIDRVQCELVQCEPDILAFTSPSRINEILNEDDDCIPPTAVTDGKKRKWKIVTKTSVDDNGFFVTKKTKEYATDSEESDNENKKESKSPAAPEPVKKASFTNKKQASLMSFFGKK